MRIAPKRLVHNGNDPHKTERQRAQQRKGPRRSIIKRMFGMRDAGIVVDDLSEKLIPIIGSLKFAAVIRNVFTPKECADLIATTESRGYEEATIHGIDGAEVLRKDVRNSGRCIVDDEGMAASWFRRVLGALEGHPLGENLVRAKNMGETNERVLRACGLNERLRFLRYLPGQYFSFHRDHSYVRGPEFGDEEGEASYLTFLLYLNEDAKGGETRFESGGRHLDVAPQVGSVLVFDHGIYHRSMPVVSGRKYCCRSDVMFTSK